MRQEIYINIFLVSFCKVCEKVVCPLAVLVFFLDKLTSELGFRVGFRVGFSS